MTACPEIGSISRVTLTPLLVQNNRLTGALVGNVGLRALCLQHSISPITHLQLREFCPARGKAILWQTWQNKY